MSQEPQRTSTIVQASFSNKDPRRAQRIEQEILRAASAVGARSTSDGFDLSSRQISFSMEPAKLSRFFDMVKNHCQHLRLAHDEVQIKARLSI